MPLSHLNRGMTEKRRHLIDGHSGEQHLDRKGVAEHMGVAALPLTIEFADIGQFEEAAIAALPVRDCALGQTVAAPKKVSRVRYWTVRYVVQGLDDERGQRQI